MEQYKYTFNQVHPDSIVNQDTYSTVDSDLISDFKINTSFNQTSDFIELHYYSLDGRLLNSIDTYTNYSSPQDSQTANNGTLDSINLRVEDDLILGDYKEGDVYLLYNFLSDPYTKDNSKLEFFIEEIAPDRLELRLLTTKLDNEQVQKLTTEFKSELNTDLLSEYFLNFGKNRLLLATNIDTLNYKDYTSVVVRLYKPLPSEISEKTTLYINKEVSSTVSYQAFATYTEPEQKPTYLKGPNFNVEQEDNTAAPSPYYSITEAFNFPVTNSYYEVKSLFEEKGAQVAIDHTDLNNFINFSSAEERLRNFKYKLDLITYYENQSREILEINSYSTASSQTYLDKINTILGNFDHYDRFLYYESSSFSWPKTGTSKPYTLVTNNTTGSWYESNLLSASIYDASNPNQLINTIPEYIREDPTNQKYTTFVHMIGQHFDNLWIYSKAVTDKYDGDNRLNFGISKDLIEEVLKNFGVKLYTSNKSTQDLFKMFTGELYETGSEGNNTTLQVEIISGSNSTLSEENYRKQVYKRLYHNLPHLLKSKGSERGIRALLSSFGVPSFYTSGSASNTGSLFLTQYGGTSTDSFNLGNLDFVTSSIDKIRIDNTGSLQGNTLSQFVSIDKRDKKYTSDLNIAEAGYSPSNYINSYLVSGARAEGFNIDNILGDPRLAHSYSYTGLANKVEEYLTEVTGSNYNLKDFTRVLKFYDNVLFKSIKDYVPARTNINTGIIIKPHVLERAKIKQVRSTFERHNEFTGSILIGQNTGSHGASFGGTDTYSTSYTASLQTSGGLATSDRYLHEEPKYNGELSGSYFRVSNGELNDENVFKYDDPVISRFRYNFIDANRDCEIVFGEYVPPSPTPTITPTNTPTPTPTATSDCSFTINVTTTTQ